MQLGAATLSATRRACRATGWAARWKSSKAAAPSSGIIDPRVTQHHFSEVFQLSPKNLADLGMDWREVWQAEYGNTTLDQVLAGSRGARARAAGQRMAHATGSASTGRILRGELDDLPPAPHNGEWADLAAYDTVDEGGEVAPIFGDSVAKLPRTVIEEASLIDDKLAYRPLEDRLHDDQNKQAGMVPSYMASMSAEERELERERKLLQSQLLDKTPMPTNPLFEWSYTLLDVRQTANVLPGGIANTIKVLVVGGNHAGAIGFGVGKDPEDPEVATKQAVEKVHENAIAVSTYRGQLPHDLIGKKNNQLCIIRTRAPGYDGHADDLISWAMAHIGCKYYSGKFTGGNRKNIYTKVLSLFDAFSYVEPHEDAALKRGLRWVHLTEDRHAPRNIFPLTGRGPSFLGSRYNSRFNRK